MTCPEGAIDSGIFDFTAAQREQLAASALGSLAPDERVVDLFCGAGGWGDGLAALGIRTDFAVNHDPVAIEFHARNHPHCVHHTGDAWRTKPRDVVGSAKVGLLLASAACTTHSRARGSAPVSKRVHMLGTCILRWMKDTAPRVVLVENVAEWMDWGPLIEKRDERGRVVRDAQGRAVWTHDPARKGTKWRWWLRQAKRLGYALEFGVFDASDFGSASRRKRLFVILRRDGQPIVWPEKTHGKEGAQAKADGSRVCAAAAAGITVEATAKRTIEGGFGARRGDRQTRGEDQGVPTHHRSPGCLIPHRAAHEVIDWSDLGTSIFDRKKPLADKTLARICEGIRRFVLNDPAPFILRVTQTGAGGGWKVSSADAPLPTQTTRQDLAVATPVVQVFRGNAIATPPGQPLPTITAGNGAGRGGGAGHAIGMATPIITPCGGPKREPSRVADLFNTVLTREDRGLCCPIIAPQNTDVYGQRVDAPGPTITTKGHQSLIAPVLNYFRSGGGQHSDVRDPLLGMTAQGTHAALVAALFVKFYGNESGGADPRKPLGTVTTVDRHGLVCCVLDGEPFVVVDILFRMLRPAELARAMGFRDDYIWPTTQRDAVRLIGNAVSPPMARALAGAVLPGGRGDAGRRECAA